MHQIEEYLDINEACSVGSMSGFLENESLI
jgi:hypothetical protein